MNEFLVNIKITWPRDLTQAEINRISYQEVKLAARYADEGRLVRMWRVPGRLENWGLWRAADATELHETISSLPVWPFMDVTVHPLAAHTVDPGPSA